MRLLCTKYYEASHIIPLNRLKATLTLFTINQSHSSLLIVATSSRIIPRSRSHSSLVFDHRLHHKKKTLHKSETRLEFVTFDLISFATRDKNISSTFYSRLIKVTCHFFQRFIKKMLQSFASNTRPKFVTFYFIYD